ncbi:hypothetical protein KP509_30G025300 [Ceratopteris richardii]|uniref:non-specific serine/threonine protein kinase n=1 Tax=Ceratopteris richardii TaxID=49495 RepID=A0A8T2R0M4_CERRI|nr:hypothetical protein KP509_30G025300 [Ceratopteris richardii]
MGNCVGGNADASATASPTHNQQKQQKVQENHPEAHAHDATQSHTKTDNKRPGGHNEATSAHGTSSSTTPSTAGQHGKGNSAHSSGTAGAGVNAPKPAKTPAIMGPVLNRPMDDVKNYYTLGKELGRGQFGVTHLCTEKATGKLYACKSIAKRKLTNKDDIEDVRREVQIMHHLAGQPNIVEMKGAYEDKQSVHLVMELCAGGELFDRIIAKGHYTEKAAAAACRTIVQVVHTCHVMGVIHRDLKPENFLLQSKRDDSPLKATDFGLSVFFKPGDVFKDIVGSAYYVAPEVLRRHYGPEADIWSAGVILFILLSGVPPFWAETEQGIFDAILKGQIDYSSDPWPSISHGALDLVKKMLTQDPKERLTAAQVLSHPWIRVDGEASDKPIDNAVLGRMKQFRAMNKLKKLALKVIAESLSEEEIMGLKQMFRSMDTDNSGTITFEELKIGLAKQGSKLAEHEVRQLMDAVSGHFQRALSVTALCHF